MRLRWLSLAFLLLALPAHGFDFKETTESDGRKATGLQPGATAYALVTSSGSGFVGVSQCANPVGSVVCNTSSASDHDCTAVFWRCPVLASGAYTADPLTCRVDKYQDASGTWRSELTGDADAVRDLNEIDPTPVLVAVVMTVNQTTRVQVDCR